MAKHPIQVGTVVRIIRHRDYPNTAKVKWVDHEGGAVVLHTKLDQYYNWNIADLEAAFVQRVMSVNTAQFVPGMAEETPDRVPIAWHEVGMHGYLSTSGWNHYLCTICTATGAITAMVPVEGMGAPKKD